MKEQELIDLTLEELDSFLDHPFNGGKRVEKIKWHVVRHQRNKKIFAMIYTRDNELMINLKMTIPHNEMMRERKGVYPGYHMNKAHWSTIKVNDTDVTLTELQNMIHESAELTKK